MHTRQTEYKGPEFKLRTRGNVWTTRDHRFVRDNWESLTDEQMGCHLGKSADAIKAYRHRPENSFFRSGAPVVRAGTMQHRFGWNYTRNPRQYHLPFDGSKMCDCTTRACLCPVHRDPYNPDHERQLDLFACTEDAQLSILIAA